MTDLMIILGSPASGKTTLARRLSADLAWPCLSKDDVKEALFDVLGCGDRAQSRRFSDVSFAALLRLAGTQLNVGVSCLVEGNWRSEHAARLSAVAAPAQARTSQVWCRATPPEMARRFRARSRHPAHLDTEVLEEEIQQWSGQSPAFLELPGPRWIYDSDVAGAYERLAASLRIWCL